MTETIHVTSRAAPASARVSRSLTIVSGLLALVCGAALAESRIAYTSCKGNTSGEIYLADPVDGARTRLTYWSPDATHLCFTSKRAGSWEIFIVGADGDGVAQLTHDGVNTQVLVPAWSPELDSIAAPATPDTWAEVKLVR